MGIKGEQDEESGRGGGVSATEIDADGEASDWF